MPEATNTTKIAVPTTTMPFRHVIAVTLGNGLEFFDFLSYTIFAVYIAKAFFPADGNHFISLIVTFGLSWAAYLMRIAGAMVLGGIGDRLGRKPAMLISFGCMGAGMLAMALTPTYASIGIAAPVIVIVFRLVQGFGLGGEVGPTTAYMVEAAPEGRRGFYGSFQYVSQDAAVVLASLIGVIMSKLMSPADLAGWGWRIPFLLGVLIIPFGIWIRKSLPETLNEEADKDLAQQYTSSHPKLAEQLKQMKVYWLVLLCGFFILTAGSITTYVFDYMPTFSITTLGLPATIAFSTTMISSSTNMVFEMLGGALSDRFGRRPVMIVPGILFLIGLIPGFWLVLHHPGTWSLYLFLSVFSALYSLSFTPQLTALTESLPMHIRAGTVATVYALAIAIFGGSTQMVVTGLLHVTHGNHYMPFLYALGAMALGVTAMIFIPESAPVKLKHRNSSST